MSYPTVGVLSAAHALEDGLVEPQLQTGLVEHLPLVAVPGDQAVDLDRLGLADTVTPGLGLEEDAFIRSEKFYSTFDLLFCSAQSTGVYSAGDVRSKQRTNDTVQ